ncbi:MAG: alpha/beta hydrolase [Bacteroidota bacterium]
MLRLLIFISCLFPLVVSAADSDKLQLEEAVYTTLGGKKVKAEKGTLSILENRNDPTSTKIKVQFVRLKSRKKTNLSPVIYLEGGPGSSCSWQAENPHMLERWLPILAQRDVILYDQRGTGAASDRLTWINFLPLPEDVLVSEEAANAHYLDMTQRALPHWKENGIDITGYTTLSNAQDIDELRQALGIQQFAILGFSYGTHLGQAYLKYFGTSVEKAILVGVEGLDENFKVASVLDEQLATISAIVTTDSTLRQEVPDLTALYQRVSDKLTASPIELELQSPLTGQPVTMKVGKFGLDMILFRDFGDASDLPVFPRLLYTIDQGDYSVFRWFVQKRFSGLFGLQAMAASTDIASGFSPERKQMIERSAAQSRFKNIVNTPYLAMAEVWPDVDLGEDYRAPFTSSVPTLILSGTLDSNTPVQQGERLAKQLTNAHHIIVENAGHEQIMTHPKAGQAIVDFLAGKDVSSVTAAYPPLQFIPVSGDEGTDRHPSLQE